MSTYMSSDDNILETAMKIFLNVLEYTTAATNKAYQYVTSNQKIQEIGFSLLMTYSSYVEYFKEIFNEIYIEYPVVKFITDESTYLAKYANSVYNKTSIEPKSSSWISTSILYKFEVKEYGQFMESYYPLDHEIYDNERIIARKYEEFCDLTVSIFDDTSVVAEDNNDVNELLTIMKTSGQYITYFVADNKKDKQRHIRLPVETSKVSFLSIEYTHPNMEHSIPLDINNGYMLTNNVLFSPLFVRRMLSFQSTPFVFDMDYVLKIMDSDVNLVELKSNQYIQLNDKGYMVVDRRGAETVVDK